MVENADARRWQPHARGNHCREELVINSSGIHWNEPATWPWIVYVWGLFIIAGYFRPAWLWLQRHRAADWPAADGRIESTEIVKSGFFMKSRTGRYDAVLHYSYSSAGSPHFGQYKREFPSEEDAEEFLRDLEGKPVTVRHKPANPSRSMLFDSDLENTLQNRAAITPTLSLAEVNITPGPIRALPFLFSLLALLGLILSLWVHIGALLGLRVAPAAFFWVLHIGIFVVWFPAVLAARKRVGNLNRRDFWKVVLKDAPDWMRYMVYVFFGYAVVNFAIFFLNTAGGSDGANPPATVWRGFSGHWMLFYSAAFAILYSASRDRHEA